MASSHALEAIVINRSTQTTKVFTPFYLKILYLQILFILLLFSTASYANQFELTNDQTEYNVGKHLDYFVDESNQLTIEEITTRFDQFQPVHTNIPNFQFTDKAHWFRVKFQNNSQLSEWLLEFEYSLLDYVDMYIYSNGETRIVKLGDTFPFAEREFSHRNFVVPLTLNTNQTIEMVFRVQTESSLQLPLYLWEKDAFNAKEYHSQYFYGIYYGVLMIMVIYSLLMSVLLRDKAYLFYFLHILGYGLVQVSLNGYAFEYLWPNNPWWANKATPFFIGIGFLGVSTFTMTFLHLRELHPRLHSGFKFFYWLCLFICVSSLFLEYQFVIKVATAASGIIALCAFSAGYISWRGGFKPARYFLLAWGVFFLGITLYVLKTFNLVPTNQLTIHCMQIGSSLEVLLLSFALADRINILTDENRRMHAETNETLQKEVDKRTAELQKMTAAAVKSSEEANHAKEVAEAATKSKSEFLATMSHEIRTPMNGVMGMADLLRETPLNKQQGEYVDTIASSGKALIGVINDILDFSKIEAGKMDIESAPFHLESALEECISIFAFKISEHNVKLYIDSNLDQIGEISTDQTRLRQILVNLLGNAFKFTERGEVCLSYFLETYEGGISKLKFKIKDTGIGMSDEQIKKVFGSFSQADATTTRKYGGTGLGLSISKQLIELMGGEIGVESEPGVGSTFWFTILLPEPVQMTSLKDIYAGKRIGMVSYNEVARDNLRPHIQHWGMHFDEFNDLATLIKYYKAHLDQVPDVLFVDFEGNEEIVPVMDMLREEKLKEKMKHVVVFGNAGMLPIQDLYSYDVKISTLEHPISATKLRHFINGVYSQIEIWSNNTGRQPLSLEHLKVLVAEDNVVNQSVIKGMLKKFGIQPIIATNGLEAVAAVNDKLNSDDMPYDLILMDCEMPELDGFAATEQIRCIEKEGGYSGSKIVALTAHALSEHKESCQRVGMDGHLSKPISKHQLQVFLDNNFNQRH